MRPIVLFTALGLWLAQVLGLSAKPPEKSGGCGNHGTSVQFVDTPSEAARQAAKEEKLVFVLHVSGHFEDPRFT
jgi:hypothetical protein